MKFPILYWEQNLLFDHLLQPWAVYRIPLKPYAYQSLEKKRGTVASFQHFLHGFHGEGQLLSVTRMMDAEQWRAGRKGTGPEYERYVQAVMQRFAERRPWQRSLYLLLRLSSGFRDMPEIDFSGLRHTMETIKRVLGYLGRSVQEQFWYRPRGELEMERVIQARAAEALQYAHVFSHLQGERCQPKDIEWMIRRGFYRGLTREPELALRDDSYHEVIVKGEKVSLRPKKSMPLQLSGDLVGEEKMKTWIVHHDDRDDGVKSYQAFFAVVDVPEDIPTVGNEWLYMLEDLPFPAEVSLHFKVETPHEAAGGLQRSRKVLRDQRREYREASEEAPLTLEWAGKRGRVLENKLQKGMPLVWMSAWLNVSGANRKELEERVSQLLQLYAARHVRIVRSPADQAKAFQLFLPGSRMDEQRRIPMDPKFLAAAVLHGSREIGDPDGEYIGRTVHNIPVLLDLQRPMKALNRSGAMVVVGTLGSGKSVLKKTLYYQAFNQGGIVFAIDPKGEDACFMFIPEIRQQMVLLNFAADSATRFNPFRMSQSEERNHGIVLDFLSLLLEGTKNDERADVIMEAVERTFAGEKRDLFQLIREMQHLADEAPVEAMRVEARRCVNRLQSYSKSPYGKFVFARDGEEQTRLTHARFVVITLAGLPLPKRRGNDRLQGGLTPNERFGLGIMYLVAALGREFMFYSPHDVLKVFGIDESWMLKAFPEGALLIDEIIRMGRSFDVVPLIVTQNPSDVAEEETRNNLGCIFCFRTEDPRAIADNLTLLGLDPQDEEMIHAFRELKSGDCFMKDISGRIGRVRIEPTPDDLLRIFHTTPSSGEREGMP